MGFEIAKKLLYFFAVRSLIATLQILATVLITFSLLNLAPGGPLSFLIREFEPDPEYLKTLVKEFDLDKPVLQRFFQYIQKISYGDLGISFYTRLPVSVLISERLPATLLLTLSAQTLALVGIVIGTFAAKLIETRADRIIRIFGAVVYSLPPFWLGMLLLYTLSLQLKIFPTHGMLSPNSNPAAIERVIDILSHLILPMTSLAAVNLAFLLRLTRANVVLTLQEDFILTLKAKGLRETKILFRHVLKASALPIVAAVGVNFGYSVSGSLLVETVFSWPGLGKLLFDSIISRDIPVVAGIFIAVTVVTIIANLAADIVSRWIDPRTTGGKNAT